MHVPDITDQMFEKVRESASAPIVLVLHAGRGDFFRFLEAIASDFDQYLILLAVSVDENPSFEDLVDGRLPVCLAYKQTRVVSRWDLSIGESGHGLRKFLENLLPEQAQ